MAHGDKGPAQDPNKAAAAALRESLGMGGGSTEAPAAATPVHTKGEKRKADNNEESDEEDPPDDVRLWESGWKDRYYENKFSKSSQDREFVQSVAQAYMEGLCWVLAYYFQGCASWTWYYPFHYAPFASDIAHADLKEYVCVVACRCFGSSFHARPSARVVERMRSATLSRDSVVTTLLTCVSLAPLLRRR